MPDNQVHFLLNNGVVEAYNHNGGLLGRPNIGSVTLTEAYGFTVPGNIAVPSGATDYINGFFVSLPSGESAQLVGYKAVIRGGTSCTVKVTKNGSDVTGFTGISVTTSSAGASPTAVDLADGDFVQIVVTAVSGSPDNLSFTTFVKRTLKVG